MHALGSIKQSRVNSICIISARAVSDFSTYLNMVALLTYVYLLSTSVVYVSAFLFCRVAGGILASLCGTPFFRRFSGRKSLMGFDMMRATLLLILLVLPKAQQLYVLPLIGFGIGLGNAMFAIGLNSQLPHMVIAEQRISTNAWVTSLAATGAVLGSLTSGLLVASNGYPAVFALGIATYLVAATLILPMRLLSLPEPNTAMHHHNEWHLLLQGLRGSPLLACMLLVSMADTLGSAAHNVGMPILSKLLTPSTASTTMGLLLAIWAAGKFSGARLTNFLLKGRGLVWMERWFFSGVCLMSVGFILVFQQKSMPIPLWFAALAGIGDGMSEVSLISRAQVEPDSLRLPIFSLLTLMQMTGFGVGMLLVAPFYLWWQPSSVILLFHGLPLSVLLLVQILLWRVGPKWRAAQSQRDI